MADADRRVELGRWIGLTLVFEAVGFARGCARAGLPLVAGATTALVPALLTGLLFRGLSPRLGLSPKLRA